MTNPNVFVRTIDVRERGVWRDLKGMQVSNSLKEQTLEEEVCGKYT